MKLEDAYLLIEKTKKDYDLIFKDFHRTRQKPWTEFNYFKDFFQEGQKVLDFGCGDGRFYWSIYEKKINYYGVDISENLLSLAKEQIKEAQFFSISQDLTLPFKDNFFDVIVCLAVFHHIPSNFLRRRLLKEFFRVLKPQGIIILSVWDFYHGKNRKHLVRGFFLWLKNKILRERPSFDFKDLFVPWRNQKGEIVVNRYFHAFTLKELKNLFRQENFKIKETKLLPHQGKKDFYNLVVIAQK
ncbi:MAG: methyltransferase domain-containing protein [Candidatus Paceibacterota bacterium]